MGWVRPCAVALQARLSSSATYSVADVVLKGHSDNAEYALGCSTAEPLVASGGKDMKVIVWDMRGHMQISDGAYTASALQPKAVLQGHNNTIEDVCWQPGSSTLLASVGDDQKMVLWDIRFTTTWLPSPYCFPCNYDS